MITRACPLLFCALLLWTSASVPQNSAGSSTERASHSVILTSQHPSASFAVAPEVVASKPPVLFVSISKVINPEQTSLEILVYLSRSENEGADGSRVLIGNFSLYPPDRPAGFQLSTSDAFRKLAASKSSQKERQVRVVFEMRRLHEGKPWSAVELTLPPPEWRSTRK